MLNLDIYATLVSWLVANFNNMYIVHTSCTRVFAHIFEGANNTSSHIADN